MKNVRFSQMNLQATRLFLDTNVFIIGAAIPESAEED